MQVQRTWSVDSTISTQIISADIKFILVDEKSKLIPINAKLDVGLTKSEYSTYNLDNVHEKINSNTIAEHVQNLFDNSILAPEGTPEEIEQILNVLENAQMCRFYGYDSIAGKYTGILEVVYDYLNNLFALNFMEDSRPEIYQLTLTLN